MTIRLARPFVTHGVAALLTTLSLGCLPLPESLGEGLVTDDGPGSDGSSTTSTPDPSSTGEASEGTSDGANHEPDPEWELELETDTACQAVEPMPDGGVVAIVEILDGSGVRMLRRYAPDGTLLWEQPAGAAYFSISTLPDGRIVAGGSTGDPNRAAVWMLSPEGEVQAFYEPPAPGSSEVKTWVDMVDATPSHVAFVVVRFQPKEMFDYAFELAFADLDLEPSWWRTDFVGELGVSTILYTQLAASGSVRTLEVQGSRRLRTFTPTGDLESEEPLPFEPGENYPALSQGDPGILIEDVLATGYRLRGLEERPGFEVILDSEELGMDPPGLGLLQAYHHDGGLLVANTADTRHSIWVSQLDAEGTPIYARTLESMVGEYLFLFAVAPGHDGSVYLCGSQSSESGLQHNGFLLRRYPQQ